MQRTAVATTTFDMFVFFFMKRKHVRDQVKVLEVSRNRDGEFSQVARAMTLSGVHTKGVHGVSFNPESTRVVTASIDGSWCVPRRVA